MPKILLPPFFPDTVYMPIIHAVKTVYCLVKIYCDADSDSSVYNSAFYGILGT